MKLLTKEIIRRMPPLGSTDGRPHSEREIIVKFFHPFSNWTWYVLEGDPLPGGDWEFFGLVDGHEQELGYFTLSDLMSVNIRGLGIERDLYFTGTLSQVEG